MSDTIYRYDFRIGKQTRWVYRLDISAASESPLSGSPTIIPIPDFAVKLKTIKYPGYGTYNIGMQEVPSMTLEWDLNYLVDVTTTANPYDYTELKAAILRPYLNHAATTTGPVAQNWTYKMSTIYKLYIQYIGNDDNNPVPVRQFIYTLQLNPKPGEFNVVTKKVTVECLDISDWVLKAMRPLSTYAADILYSGGEGGGGEPSHVTSLSIIDLWFFKNGIFFGTAHQNFYNNDKSWSWFVLLKDLCDLFDADATAQYKKLIRGSTATFAIGRPNKLYYYEQSYDGSGEKGTALTFDELYILALITNDYIEADNSDYLIGGCLSDTNSRGIPEQWKGGMRDFLDEMYKSEFCRGIPLTADLGEIWAYPVFADENKTQAISKDDIFLLGELKNFAKGQDAVVNAITSLYEHKDEDAAKYEETDRTSFNEDNVQLPIMFNNIPTACGFEEGWKNDLRQLPTIHDIYAFMVTSKNSEIFSHEYSFYYFFSAAYFSYAMPLRVHEYIDGNLGDGKTIEGLPSIDYASLIQAPGSFFSTTTQWVDYAARDFIKKLQANTGKGFILAKALKDIYGNDKLTKMEIEVPFFLYTEFLGGGAIGFPWGATGFITKFTFDPSTLDAEYSDLPTNWYMISSELNFETEMATVELMSRII